MEKALGQEKAGCERSSNLYSRGLTEEKLIHKARSPGALRVMWKEGRVEAWRGDLLNTQKGEESQTGL